MPRAIKLTSHTLLVRIQDSMNILENNLTTFYKVKNAFFIWPSNSTFQCNYRVMKSFTHKPGHKGSASFIKN